MSDPMFVLPTPSPAAPPVVAVPSDRCWFDPYLIYRSLYTVRTNYQSVAGTRLKAAPSNPYRWAVYFQLVSSTGSQPIVSPYPDLFNSDGWLVGNGSPVRFTLTLDGPLCGGEWWAYSPNTYVLRVIEVLRK